MTYAFCPAAQGSNIDMPAQPIKVALVEDDPEQFVHLCHLIRNAPGFSCVGAFGTGEDALQALPHLNAEVVLMDIHLPGISGIDCIRVLKSSLPAARIMMFTIFENHDRIFEALRAGASGYLLKKTSGPKILEAI